ANNLIPADAFGQFELITENDVNKLSIGVSDWYKFESNEVSKYFDENTKSLVFDDLEFYTSVFVSQSDLNAFHQKVQDYIDTNNFSEESFANWIKSNNFKTFISENLKVENNKLIDINAIGTIEYDEVSKTITINPNTKYKFMLNANLVDNFK
ncbi:MAG: hypothetical protein K2L64_02950, partial [Ureaplasma sp.]|nr:hypothetical protein [Ureaplasma sp.]